MFQNLNRVIDQVSKDRGISRDLLVDAIEKAFVKVAQREFGKNKDIEAAFNHDLGEVELFEFKEVVETVEEPEREITLEDARAQLDPEAEIGDSLGIKLDADIFGRISAQMAKQVIIQHIETAERETIVSEYSDKVGTIISGVVRNFKKGSVVVDLGKSDAFMPRKEQIPKEKYQIGDRVRAYLKEIQHNLKEPQIVLSRSDPMFIKKLFELEVPEVYDRTVEVIDVARDPGYRAKISVKSHNPNVDPVGACVGMKGVRVQAVVQELRGERIDIIEHSEDPVRYVCNALNPADVLQVTMDDETHSMEIIVPDDQLSQAIGRKGQNVTLTSELTGWKINIKSESEASMESKKAHEELRSIPGVDLVTAELLYNAGYMSLEELLNASEEELGGVQGIGVKLAREIQLAVRQQLEERKQEALASGVLQPEGGEEGEEPTDAPPHVIGIPAGGLVAPASGEESG